MSSKELYLPPSVPIYHYTTQLGLLGIISSGQIWASALFYMNDAAEFTYTVEIARQLLLKFKNAMLPEHSIVIDAMGHALTYASSQYTFVCSFSEEKDLLSQWRAYSPSGNGFSIGFDYSQLKDPMERQGFKLGRCIYDEQEQIELLLQVLQSLFDHYVQELAKPDGLPAQRVADFTSYLFVEIVQQIAPLFKHPSFKEEKEWRLISKPLKLGDQSIQHREGKSMIIPYLNFDLKGTDGKMIIKEIVVGPAPHMELSRQSVNSLLLTKIHEPCDIQLSKIPYRAW